MAVSPKDLSLLIIEMAFAVFRFEFSLKTMSKPPVLTTATCDDVRSLGSASERQKIESKRYHLEELRTEVNSEHSRLLSLDGGAGEHHEQGERPE
jgi:hypothetical protein